MLQQRFANGFQFGGTNENGSASLSAIFPWMNGQTNSESSTDAEIIKGFDVVQDLSQHNAIDHDEVSHMMRFMREIEANVRYWRCIYWRF